MGSKSVVPRKPKGVAEEEPAGTEAAVRKVSPLRPAQCRRYMRKRLAEEFPGIVQGFLEGAKTGSCAHLKLATELLGEPERTRSRRKGSAAKLLEQLGRH